MKRLSTRARDTRASVNKKHVSLKVNSDECRRNSVTAGLPEEVWQPGKNEDRPHPRKGFLSDIRRHFRLKGKDGTPTRTP